jgi:fermentation-respiration switch protein FrsA (DUF1100 family)
VLVLAAAAGGALALLAGCAEPFFFHPNRTTYMTRRMLGGRVEDVFFDSDGSRLHGWWLPAVGPARGTVVHLHGNAANVSNHARLVAWLPEEGLNVLTFDYRGFGHSDGTPSLDGVVEDAHAAIGEARRRHPGLPIVLLGQSLGGSTAVRAAAEDTGDDIRLLVVESAFSSYRGIVRDATRNTVLAVVGSIAASTLPREAMDPASAMSRVHAPVLILHGDSDRVVPIGHSEQLYAAAPGPKEVIRIAGGEHLDALQRTDIRRRVLDAILAVL